MCIPTRRAFVVVFDVLGEYARNAPKTTIATIAKIMRAETTEDIALFVSIKSTWNENRVELFEIEHYEDCSEDQNFIELELSNTDYETENLHCTDRHSGNVGFLFATHSR